MTEKYHNVTLREVAPPNQAEMPREDETVWNLSLEDIESVSGKILRRVTCRVAELGSSKCAFDQRHVLYSKLRPYLNKVALPDKRGVGTSELIPLLPDPKQLDREYFCFYLRSPDFVYFATSLMQGANLPRVAMSEFWKHQLSLPPVTRQRSVVVRIKECLSRVEEMQRLRDDAFADTPLVEERFLAELELSLDGCSVPLSELLAETKNGKSLQNKENVHNGRALTLSAVRTHRLDMSASKSVQINTERDDNYLMQPGDVLISRSNTRELVALSAIAPDHIDEPTIFSDLLIRLRPKPKAIRPLYLTIALRMPGVRHQLRANAVGSSQTMVKISGERLRTVKVPCPSPAEQERIEAKYTEVASVTSAISEELTEQTKDLNAFREAILREAFAGNL